MKILIVEPEINGHHFAMYVRFLVRGLVKKNISFSILTTKKILKHPVLKIIKKEKKKINFFFLEDLDYPEDKNVLSLIKFQLSNFNKIKKGFESIKNIKFDHIFLVTIDHIDKVMPFFGSPFGKNKFSSIILNPKNHFSYYRITKNNFKYNIYNIFLKRILKLNNLKNLYSNDPLFVRFTKKKYKIYKNKINFFDEPVELECLISKNLAKKKLGISSKTFVILVYGAIKSSKSISDLIHFTTSKEINKKIKILICGKQTIEIKNLLKKKLYKNLIKRKKIIINNKFLSLKDESLVFSAADLTWIVYKNSSLGSSGVFYMSIKAKTPLATANDGIPGYLNKKYQLGPIIHLNNHKQSIKKLHELSNYSFMYRMYQKQLSIISKKKFQNNFYEKILKNFFLYK